MELSEKVKKGLETCIGKCTGNKPHCPYHACGDGRMDSMNLDAIAYIRQLEAELAQVKAERDRYWEYIKGLGCDTCGGDCDRCEVGLDRVWSGWVWDGEKEEERDHECDATGKEL